VSQPPMVEERALLLSTLNAQRKHVQGILEGLPEESLRRAVLPSRWTCVGLVQHLAADVERFWFRAVLAGEQAVIDELAGDSDAWRVASDVPVEEVFDAYQREIDFANALITDTHLNTVPAWWPDFFGDWRLHNLREIILHVTTETACHAGHLDVVRELIDGRRWLILTE